MPGKLKSGGGKKNFEHNLHELHHGGQYKRTMSEHGKDVANAQALAIAYKEKRKGKKK